MRNDLISRQDAIDAIVAWTVEDRPDIEMPTDLVERINALSSSQPEITNEQAILHLHSTGWMQNHDREMYEGELRKQLEYNSGGYDSIIPCTDTISRQEAIDAIRASTSKYTGFMEMEMYTDDDAVEAIECLPSAQQCKYWDMESNVCALHRPSAQPELAIPLSWIEGQIKWLKSLDNAFSTLAAGQISSMVEIWKDEQDEIDKPDEKN